MTECLTPKYRIGPYDCITLEGVAHQRREILTDGYVLARVDNPKLTTPFSNARIHDLVGRPGYKFERNLLAPGVATARYESGVDRIADLPLIEQDVVLWRQRICGEFLQMEKAGEATRSDNSMKKALRVIQESITKEEEAKAVRLNAQGDPVKPRAGTAPPPVPRPPSPRTLRTWLKRLEAGGHMAYALRKAYRRCGDRLTQRFDEEERALLKKYAEEYATENRPSIQDVHAAMKAEIVGLNAERRAAALPSLRVPSYHRLCQEIRSLPEFEVHAGRYGLPAAMRKFAMVATGPDVERPLQRVEMDEYKVDLFAMCQDAGIIARLSDDLRRQIAGMRPWICVAIDARTRVILGMRMGLSPDARLALETLEMVVSPKAAYAKDAGALSSWDYGGSPEAVVHDQAKSFLSSIFRKAVIDLGAEPDSPPAGLAHHRGRIERLFRTAGTQVLAPFTGRAFGSVEERGDYDPQTRVSLELSELCRVLVRWVVDRYHGSPHAGLGGETPANAWARLVAMHAIIPPPDRHVRRAIFGLDLDRVLSARGVRVLGLFYNAHELQAYRRRHGDVTVAVRVDAMDLGHVSVRLGDAGWLAVPCMRAGFDDVSIETWQAASADLRRRFAAEARLNDEIVAAAVRDAWALARQTRTRAGILSNRPTREEIDRDEAKLGLGFPDPSTDPTAPSPLGGDLMSNVIPAGRDPVRLPSDPTPTRRRRRGRAVKRED